MHSRSEPRACAEGCDPARSCADCGHEHARGCFDCEVGEGWDEYIRAEHKADHRPCRDAEGKFTSPLLCAIDLPEVAY